VVVLSFSLLWLARAPCMPVELGLLPPPKPPPSAPLAAPLPKPPPPDAPLPSPLAARESARYRVDYGVLSGVGEIRLSIDGPRGAGRDRLVRVAGDGEGSIFGFGRTEKHVRADFDPQRLGPRRAPRLLPGPSPVALDPVSFLLRLRVAPPVPGGAPQVLQVLDGRELWRVSVVSAGRELRGDLPTIRLEAEVDPIRADGTLDDANRPHRAFRLWLSDDAAHVPLRLEMPMGIGDLTVELVELKRGG
jgi:hypothetical protein